VKGGEKLEKTSQWGAS